MHDPSRTVVIANPAARGGWVGKNWHSLASSIREQLGAVQFRQTEAIGHGAELAKDAVTSGLTTIVSFGGDGTHSEITDGIMSSDVDANVTKNITLGVLHAGTGGDFRKLIVGSGELQSACETIRTGTAAPVDVGWVEYLHDRGTRESRHFLNITSLGMGGLVDRYVAKSRRLFGGTAAYLGATLRAQVTYKPARIRLRVDGVERGEFSVSAVCVCNGRWAGGGMMFAPNAKLGDGRFEVVVIEATSTLKGLPIMKGLYSGTHVRSPFVHTFQAREVDVDVLANTAWMDIDGEAPGTAPARFQIKPAALRVLGVQPEFL